MKGKQIYPSNQSAFSPKSTGIHRYPSASAVTKAEIPRAIVYDPEDDETIETILTNPSQISRRGSEFLDPLPVFSPANNKLSRKESFEMIQDVTPDKKWSVKRDCFLERESAYNSSLDVKMNEAKLRGFLTSKFWPVGVQNIFTRNVRKVPLRIFICDDSGSMVTSDGKRLHGEGPTTKALTCTRWAELSESLRFHLKLAQEGMLPSEFRLLNGAAPVLVGVSSSIDSEAQSLSQGTVSNLTRLLAAFEESPSGQTPLCWHIRDVIKHIEPIASKLRLAGQKIAIIIATDGEPTDGDLVETLRPLQQLPVWLIIRLCTDDERIVAFWNNVDTQLELDMDVIDDLFRESEGISAVNSWLTYSEPLHRLREFGITVKEFDLLDESTLTGDQIRSVAAMLLDKSLEEIPHPDINPRAFADSIALASRNVPQVWDPVSKKMQNLLKSAEVRKLFKPEQTGCIIL